MMKIGIIGAGIGGLTLATMLKDQDHQIEVFEKNPVIQEVGAGIGIGHNVLDKLGDHDLAKGIKNAGQIIEGMHFLDDEGRQLNQMTMSSKQTNVTLLRQTLVELIASYLPEDMIHFQHEIKQVEVKDEQAFIHFEKQSSRHFDFVVGADGVHSKVRQSVNPKTKVLYQGYTCFRGVVDDMEELPRIGMEYWGRKGRFGIVSLLNGKAYWFASINAKENDLHFKQFNKPYLQAYFNHYPDPVRRVLDRQPETEILHHDLYDMKPLKTFVYQQRVVLLGDAAHTTTPNMGQGAGQAMEDAIVLANVLNKYERLEDALKRYNQLRVKHTAKVIKRSRKIGKIAQKDGRMSTKLRNASFKRLPSKMLSGQTKFLFKTKNQ